MKDFAYRFINQVRHEATKRKTSVTTVSGGRTRVFYAYDWGTDTFIFERDVWKTHLVHAPVLIVRKSALIDGRDGRIMTITSGSHATAAIPLLRGDFWNLGRTPDRRKNDVMSHDILCANIVNDGGTIDLSQRDVPIAEMYSADDWLRGLGWSLTNVVIAERSDEAVDFYRKLGQEWRIKPLVWTRKEMDFALAASRTRIHSSFNYYHSVKGVHFISFEDFSALLPLCSVDFEAMRLCLDELAKPAEVGEMAALLDPKHGHHHEIELFGIRDPAAASHIAQMLIDLHQALDTLTHEQCEDRIFEIINVYRSALSFPELADSGSELFVSSMYKHLTGVIYNTQDQVVPAFDDRKTALPGATFRGDKPDFHPGVDMRTRALVDYVQSLLSAGEVIEYLNVYELCAPDGTVAKMPTREIEFKTSHRPVPRKLLEKRLAQSGIDYASYMLARVQSFQSLGISFGDHHLLQRHDRGNSSTYYFVRERYSGFAINAISNNRFQRADGANGEFVDFPAAILRTAAQAGRAAAHTMVIKKYIAGPNPIHFGEGKEIIEFDHDIAWGCEMPCGMRLCSARGSLGWPCIDKTPENLAVCFEIYTDAFARAAVDFWDKNSGAVSLDAILDNFCAGFSTATKEIYGNYHNNRDLFNTFDPKLRESFRFRPKWLFALWALERQFDSIDRLSAMIKVAASRLAASNDGIDLGIATDGGAGSR